jgi:K+-transporting ATPase ATPase C chain
MNTQAAIRPALVLLVLLSIVTGLAYPLLTTGIAYALFNDRAHGSLVERSGTIVGSALIGQPSGDPAHFWARPSATSPQPGNASASGGSNLGPLNPALVDAVKARIDALKAADKDAGVAGDDPIPQDLVTASASGLDPHISPAAARWQAARVAKTTGMPIDDVRRLIDEHTEPAQWGFLGEARVNVLLLNLALDAKR